MFGREPVLWLALVAAVIDVAVGFGAPVSPEQVGLINALVVAVISFIARSKVTPVE